MERILKKASKTHKHRVEVSFEFMCENPILHLMKIVITTLTHRAQKSWQ